ncbi:hypothetical protein F2P47_04955 [Parvibaculum sedimenti]|uniref:Uncharacterized protein n=1 Tax=Parvibaculum sedimenti TaxID=2608632 RepID=A0A6N6VQE2_9HYPH|nr:hypothetical protein [Parvibaculum sedimenti]KAB7741754.1 hypothetical protein F2P47_04955 [Parvibaculum sedimenti]
MTAIKGVAHQPASPMSIKPETRDALLAAIAKARSWIDDIVAGRIDSLDEIARREGKVERHIRLLAPLAFVSLQVVRAIVAGDACDIT